MTEKTVRIMVSLDSILDTRIATVATFSEQLAIDILNSNYHDRRSDHFEGIDRSEYLKKYNNRGIEVISKSQVTAMVLFLQELVKALAKQAVNTPFQSKIEILVNTHPYSLEVGVVSGIISAVVHWTKGIASVSQVSVSEKELTPSYLKNYIDILIMYDYESWLECQTMNFNNTPIPSVNLYVPAISFTYKLENEIIDKVKQETKMHPLDATKFLLAPFINLEPIDVATFSVMK